MKSSLLLATNCSSGIITHGTICPNFTVFMQYLNLSTPTRFLIILVHLG